MTSITIVSGDSRYGAHLASSLAESLRASGKFDSVRVVDAPKPNFASKEASSGYVPASDLIKHQEDREREESERDGIDSIKNSPSCGTFSLKIPAGVYLGSATIDPAQLGQATLGENNSVDNQESACSCHECTGSDCQNAITMTMFGSKLRDIVVQYAMLTFPLFKFWGEEVVLDDKRGFIAFNLIISDHVRAFIIPVEFPFEAINASTFRVTDKIGALLSSLHDNIYKTANSF